MAVAHAPGVPMASLHPKKTPEIDQFVHLDHETPILGVKINKCLKPPPR